MELFSIRIQRTFQLVSTHEFSFVKLSFDLQPHFSASGNLRSGIRSVVGAKLWRFILL